MSVHVLSWVLKNSEATLADRLVLLVLADHAKQDGTFAWPSLATIAREARISERKVRYSLRALEVAGAIAETGRTKEGCHIYSVLMRGADSAGAESAGGQNRAAPPAGSAPEPSLEQPSVQTQTSSVSGTLAKTNGVVTPLKTAQTVVGDVVDVCAEFDVPLSTRHRGMLGKQAEDLLKSGFDYEVVVLACVMAVRRAEPQNAHFIASDLVLTRAGQRITRKDYERALRDEQEIANRERRRR